MRASLLPFSHQGEFEQHISGDIALAARQYWYATGDKAWLAAIGYPITKGVAEFYAKRAALRPAQRGYKVSAAAAAGAAAAYDINGVMGPDEYAFPVNNSAYTNAAAIIALSFATEAATVLGKTADPAWATVAAGLSLEVAPDVPNHPELKGGYHPEYKGFPKNPKNPKVKQGDTILLSYPLGASARAARFGLFLAAFHPRVFHCLLLRRRSRCLVRVCVCLCVCARGVCANHRVPPPPLCLPAGVNMSTTLLRNDLTFYDPITDPNVCASSTLCCLFSLAWVFT